MAREAEAGAGRRRAGRRLNKGVDGEGKGKGRRARDWPEKRRARRVNKGLEGWSKAAEARAADKRNKKERKLQEKEALKREQEELLKMEQIKASKDAKRRQRLQDLDPGSSSVRSASTTALDLSGGYQALLLQPSNTRLWIAVHRPGP